MDRRDFDDVVQRAARKTWRAAHGSGPVLSIRYPHGAIEDAGKAFWPLEKVEQTAHALGVPLKLTGGGYGCIDFDFSTDGTSQEALEALVETPDFIRALNETPATVVSIRRTTRPKDFERCAEQPIYVFTNRNPDRFSHFGEEALQTVSSAIYLVDRPVTAAKRGRSADFWLGGPRKPGFRLARKGTPDEIAAEAAKGAQGLLLCVHGISTSFASGLLGTAKLADKLEADKLGFSACLFSWPADGNPVKDYDAIARSGANSEAPLASTLATLGKTAKPVHVLAHSHGNQLLLRAAKELLKSKTPLAATFKSALLVAADVDHRFMQNNLPDLMAVFGQAALYFCSRDIALKLSGRKFQAERAGAVAIGTGRLKVDSINVDHIVSIKRGWGHSYHEDTEPMANDMYYALQGVPAGTRFGLADGGRPGLFVFGGQRDAA